MKSNNRYPQPSDRAPLLTLRRNLKMAKSAHAYVRGNTARFYEWLSSKPGASIPHGPSIWICGDCHVGNLGPLADSDERTSIAIRDLDQTVIGNPAHDLVRLGLSLASAARGSDLPGITTAEMLEHMVLGYEKGFSGNRNIARKPHFVKVTLRSALSRNWSELARERIEDTEPKIPLGKRFWPISASERKDIHAIFEGERARSLVTSLRSRDDDASVRVVDAAYWVKGCSSLGRLRYAILVAVGKKEKELCLMDIKEAVQAAAPHRKGVAMPKENAERVMAGAQKLSPALGERMMSARLQDRGVFIRELMPQDLKFEVENLSPKEAIRTAQYLAWIVGEAHARQMDPATRRSWRKELAVKRTKTLHAPSWLWNSVVQLMVNHEGAYLDHCRRCAGAMR